ncbi:MAG: primosomal protein N' [Dehalococcoidia bacterium]
MAYAEVAVDSTMPSRHPFTYSVPSGMELAAGQAVHVPFGSRTLQGIVLEVTEHPSYAETRDVIAPLDERLLLSPHHIALARWLSEYCLAPLFDCLALMLPPGFRRRPLTYYEPLVVAAEVDQLPLSERQRQVLSYVVQRRRVAQEELRDGLRLPNAAAVAEQLARRGLLTRSYSLARPRVGPRVVAHVRLLVPPQRARAAAEEMLAGRARRQGLLLRRLAEEGPSWPLSTLRAQTGIDAQGLRRLAERGLVALERVVVQRDPLADRHYPSVEPPVLTPPQEDACRQIAQTLAMGGPATFLLHGVSGSGKTEVYLRALAEAVALGRRGIVLVPEIALTPQTVRRFAQRFPGRVAVMHSGLSIGEQHDQWHAIRDGNYDVVIGSRSAIFAPQPDLGLIVIDEEHEWTYKQQDSSPRYHAREVAERLAELTGAVLVAGSATPSLESYHQAHRGRYRLLLLPQRVQPAANGRGAAPVPGALPRVEVVDMREELKAGHRGIFSRALTQALEETLRAGEQAILFINRRGSASFVQCRDCGYVPRCSGCAVSLTYHAAEAVLICHQCYQRRRLPLHCPQCQSQRVRHLGLGTQKVEEEVVRLFPGARPLRWDRDATRGRGGHERVLERFLCHEADVLVGTQMVAKGLDIPAVTLVGVVAADIGLHLPDYRSAERTFQLLSQVAGRAGRGPQGGRVVVQTYSPSHYAIQAAAHYDYDAFYDKEAVLRRITSYPPYGRLARLLFAHTGEAYAQREALRLTALLRQEVAQRGLPNLQVLGPTPAFVARVRGRYRWQILLRGEDPAELLAAVPLPQGWEVDIDPVSLL